MYYDEAEDEVSREPVAGIDYKCLFVTLVVGSKTDTEKEDDLETCRILIEHALLAFELELEGIITFKYHVDRGEDGTEKPSRFFCTMDIPLSVSENSIYLLVTHNPGEKEEWDEYSGLPEPTQKTDYCNFNCSITFGDAPSLFYSGYFTRFISTSDFCISKLFHQFEYRDNLELTEANL